MKLQKTKQPYLLLSAMTLIFATLFASPARAVIFSCTPGVMCAQYFDPVCGIDGKTYSNSCAASANCMAIAYWGPCGQPTCPDLDQDGYSSNGGSCGPIDCNDMNPAINPGVTCYYVQYAPVCGVDGVTYAGSCDADKACMPIAHNGECTQPQICLDADQDGYSSTGGGCGPIDCNDTNPAINPGVICPYTLIYAPVCGVDGITYDSGCAAQQACMTIAHNGACIQLPTCTDTDHDGYSPDGGSCGPVDCNDTDPGVNPGMVCSAIYAPVCGSDSQTYTNSCEATQACVAIVSAGECYQPPVCTDNDQDGFALEGNECGQIDCNDNNAAINPGATEIKNNQSDDNCNGMGDDLEVLPRITKAEYSPKASRLTITATSALGRQDALVVEGFGAMAWDRRYGRWSLTVNKLATRKVPTKVTVTGRYGTTTINTTRTR